MNSGSAVLMLASAVVVSALLAACGDDGGGPAMATEGGTTASTSEPVTTGTAEPTTTETTPTGVDATGPGFDVPLADCGNGFVEGDEQCDDANNDDNDDCTNDCRLRCGLAWSEAVAPPTAVSMIDPRAVTRDGDDNTVVVGFLREVTTDKKGVETAEDDVIFALSLDPDGAENWSRSFGEDTGDVTVAHVAADDAGDLFVVASGDGPADDRDIFVYKLAGADGGLLWTHTFDSGADTSEDEGVGIDVGPDGDPVVAGAVSVADSDDDIWVRKLDGESGGERWTQTWSGAGNEAFSVDNAGPVAVGPDGTIYVFAQEYVTFNELLAVLFRFEIDGGEPTWAYYPTIEGGTQEYEPLAIGVDAIGDLTLTYRRISGATNTFVVEKLDADRNVLWTRDQAGFESGGGSDWSIVGAAPGRNGETIVAGSVTETADDAAWFEVWVARLDADGESICQLRQQGPAQSLVPASLRPRAVGSGADGGPLVGAQLTEETDESLWIGRFAGTL